MLLNLHCKIIFLIERILLTVIIPSPVDNVISIVRVRIVDGEYYPTMTTHFHLNQIEND